MQPSDLEPSSHSTPRSAEWFPRQPRRRLRCKAMFQMLGVFAEFERSIIWERVRAGLARAKGEGKRLGRPPIPAKLENAIREALNKPGRPGVRKIAERSGIDPGTVQRISRPRAFADGAASAVV